MVKTTSEDLRYLARGIILVIMGAAMFALLSLTGKLDNIWKDALAVIACGCFAVGWAIISAIAVDAELK